MTKEALKTALKALENLYTTCDWYGDDGREAMENAPKAIAAVKEALTSTQCEKQPAQEPVAWAVVGEGKFGPYEIGRETETDASVCKYWANRGYSLVPLYTTPQQRPWVGLTEAEMQDAHSSAAKNCPRGGDSVKWFADAIEAKLKEKNFD